MLNLSLDMFLFSAPQTSRSPDLPFSIHESYAWHHTGLNRLPIILSAVYVTGYCSCAHSHTSIRGRLCHFQADEDLLFIATSTSVRLLILLLLRITSRIEAAAAVATTTATCSFHAH